MGHLCSSMRGLLRTGAAERACSVALCGNSSHVWHHKCTPAGVGSPERDAWYVHCTVLFHLGQPPSKASSHVIQQALPVLAVTPFTATLALEYTRVGAVWRLLLNLVGAVGVGAAASGCLLDILSCRGAATCTLHRCLHRAYTPDTRMHHFDRGCCVVVDRQDVPTHTHMYGMCLVCVRLFDLLASGLTAVLGWARPGEGGGGVQPTKQGLVLVTYAVRPYAGGSAGHACWVCWPEGHQL